MQTSRFSIVACSPDGFFFGLGLPRKHSSIDNVNLCLMIYILPIPTLLFYTLTLTGCISTSPGILNLFLFNLQSQYYFATDLSSLSSILRDVHRKTGHMCPNNGGNGPVVGSPFFG
ncbi:hypothetical protein VTN77DRAFT_5399 [Rasamsonia byssochlamydoides]|uniref:uncharacterized protein n=1 Tax=Rasamsonia byssochlamydoides TaxID=89139 RepID=UPI003743ED8B